MRPDKEKDDKPSPSDTVDLHPSVPYIFSIGYEGKPIDTFIGILKEAGVERLIDVREAPYSRKPGFSKEALEKELQAAGIAYLGIPELGTDKESRDRHKADEGMDGVLQDYRVKFGKNIELYNILKKLARTKVSAIMCYEQDHRQCHRQVIEERMEADGFRVIHLGGKR